MTAPDTSTLGEWDFDNGVLPDPQGWTALDADAQRGTFFHVDDFAGLGGGQFGGLVPLSGAHSLWCGTRTSSGPFSYATPPGYGNGWEQRFESRAFPVTGAVTVNFLVHYDSEPSYDVTQFEYRSKTGTWRIFSSSTAEVVSLQQPPFPPTVWRDQCVCASVSHPTQTGRTRTACEIATAQSSSTTSPLRMSVVWWTRKTLKRRSSAH